MFMGLLRVLDDQSHKRCSADRGVVFGGWIWPRAKIPFTNSFFESVRLRIPANSSL